MSTAILSAPNHPSHPSLISGASSVSSRWEDDPNSAALVVKDEAISSNSYGLDLSFREGQHHDAHVPPAPEHDNLPIVPVCQQITRYDPYTHKPKPSPPKYVPRAVQPQLIATISVGFERGDYLIREEKGSNVYFDFLEEAYNFIVQKGYSRMSKDEEDDYMELIKRAQKSVPGGCRFNPGKLLMVLKKKLIPVVPEYCEEPRGDIMDNNSASFHSSSKFKKNGKPKHLSDSATTLPTDSESSSEGSYAKSRTSTYESSCSTSYVDSWE